MIVRERTVAKQSINLHIGRKNTTQFWKIEMVCERPILVHQNDQGKNQSSLGDRFNEVA